MIRNILILFAYFWAFGAVAQEQAAQIQFFKGTWADALAKAKAENKPIFTDFYTEWCGPCKQMSKYVFTDKEVAAFYNQHFIAVKIDAEKEEMGLVRELEIAAYPSLYYFNPDGKVITKEIGGMKAKDFLAMGQLAIDILNAAKNLPTVEQQYKKNPKDSVAMLRYIRTLTWLEETTIAEPVVKEYLGMVKETDLVKKENWEIIGQYANEVTTKEFLYVINNPKVFLNAYDEPPYKRFILTSLDKSIKRAIEEKNTTLLAQCKKYYALFNEQMGDLEVPQYHELELDIFYYKSIGDKTVYFEKLQQQTNTYLLKRPQNLVPKIFEILQNFDTEIHLNQAHTWATTLLKLEDNAISNFTMAAVLTKQKKKDMAQPYLDKASQQNTNPELKNYIEQLRQEINAK